MDTWTIEKINAAVNETRENGLIHFNFYNNTQAELENLNEFLFEKREDLILNYATEDENDLALLSSLKNIKKVRLSNYDSLDKMKNINHVVYLEIYNVNKKALDIGFFEELHNLRELRLTGKVRNIEMIGKCKNIEKLYLSTTTDNYDFARPLNKIKILCIDHCTASSDFTLLNKQTLEELSITQINKLDDIDTIKDFASLKRLALSASGIRILPAMDKLVNLRELRLELMKIWENPHIITTIPSLEKLELEEINTKLDAETFYFLTEIKTLKEIDFRFMDFNKKRIDKLNTWFIENGKENILVK